MIKMNLNIYKKTPKNEEKGLSLEKDKPPRKYYLKDNKKRFFKPKEWRNFINAIANEKHKFFFEFLLHTGMRINEAKNVRIKDIDFDNETLFIKMTKGGSSKQRTIKISTYLKNRIMTMME